MGILKTVRQQYLYALTVIIVGASFVAMFLVEKAIALFFKTELSQSAINDLNQCTTDTLTSHTREEKEVFFVNCGGFF